MKSSRIYFALAIAVLVFATTSCRNNLIDMEQTMLDRATDTSAPVLVLETPLSDSIYDQTIFISGSVSDDGTQMPTISYRLEDSLGVDALTGVIEITEETSNGGVAGSFSTELSTSIFDSDIILTIESTDWNGNVSTPIEIKLLYPGNSLPSLVVTPGNKQIGLSWEPIPEASSYTVYYNLEGSIYSESIAPTLVISAEQFAAADHQVTLDSAGYGVKNGILCQLRVTASDGTENSWASELIETVPLSSLTLVPKTESYENEIYLTWKEIKVPPSKTVNYQVWRSSNGERGSYALLSNDLLVESNYTDTTAYPGVSYFYKISVTANAATSSVGVSAQCTQMYTELEAEISRFLAGEVITDIEILNSTTAFALRRVPQISPNYYWADAEVIALDITDVSDISVISRQKAGVEAVKKLNSSVTLYDMAITDTRAYVSVYFVNDASQIQYRVFSINTSNPGSMYVETSEEINLGWPNRANSLATDTSRDILYIGISDSGAKLATVDISSGTGTVNYGDTAATGFPTDVGFDGNYAYLISFDSGSNTAYLTPFNCTTYTSPAKGTSVSLNSTGMTDCMRVSGMDINSSTDTLVIVSDTNNVDGNYYHGGVWVYDITMQSAPSFLGNKDIGIPLTDVKIFGSYAYCSAANGNIRVMGISDPTNIYQRVAYDTTGSSEGLIVNSGGIVVADGSALSSVKTNPVESLTVADTESPNQSYGSFLKDNILYLAQRFGVSAYSIAANGDLSLMNYQGMYSQNVIVLGNYAYYATGGNTSGELAIIKLSAAKDVSAAPTYFPGYTDAYDVDNWGEFLYLAESGAGVEVFDISDPEKPVSISLIPVNRSAKKVLARDDFLYISDNAYGLLCYDISDPWNPRYVGDFYNRHANAAERSAGNLSATKDHIVFSHDRGTYVLEARPTTDWAEANVADAADPASADLGSALSVINVSNSGIKAEGEILYITRSFKVHMYSLEQPVDPYLLYLSPYGLVSGNSQSIELFGNYVIVHDHYTTYSLQINQ